MQYLLTESEYDALQEAVATAKRAPKQEELQKLCTLAADKIPVRWSWGDGKGKPKPWGCILTKKGDWYCDECPAQKCCPYPHKEFSK